MQGTLRVKTTHPISHTFFSSAGIGTGRVNICKVVFAFLSSTAEEGNTFHLLCLALTNFMK